MSWWTLHFSTMDLRNKAACILVEANDKQDAMTCVGLARAELAHNDAGWEFNGVDAVPDTHLERLRAATPAIERSERA